MPFLHCKAVLVLLQPEDKNRDLDTQQVQRNEPAAITEANHFLSFLTDTLSFKIKLKALQGRDVPILLSNTKMKNEFILPGGGGVRASEKKLGVVTQSL